ncbi:MAG TPA: hypothetical protein VD908_08000 [Cytophagales bacterium]|nr:hypothetical protein [Cytophagales bacterium]
MKRIVLGLVIAVTILGCQKDDEVTDTGETSLELNGKSWNVEEWKVLIAATKLSAWGGEPCDLNAYSIVISKFNHENFVREQISIAKIPPKIGIYPIQIGKECSKNDSVGAAYFQIGAHGDVTTAVYDVLETEDNFINISEFNKSKQEISGTFQITFVDKYEISSDTLRFANCSFRTKIYK